MLKRLLKFIRLLEMRFRFLKYVPIGAYLLDCGCGDFTSSEKLIECRPDLSWNAIDIFKSDRIPKNVKFSTVDLEREKLPFPDDYFDAIMVLHVMEHIEQLNNICSELRRVLKPGGIIYIEVPSILTMFAPTSSRFFAKTGNFFDDITHKRIFTKPSLGDLIVQYLKMDAISIGTARNVFKIFLLPVTLLYSIIKWRAYVASSVGDLLGFRLYAIAKKNINSNQRNNI
jgi:SAM-dependent methyltransferase